MQETEPRLGIRIAYGVYKRCVSPLLHVMSPAECLYLPTCSEYAYVALVRFGVMKGSWLVLRRLARCHPFAKGGLDPVPGVPGGNSELGASVTIPTDHLP